MLHLQLRTRNIYRVAVHEELKAIVTICSILSRKRISMEFIIHDAFNYNKWFENVNLKTVKISKGITAYIQKSLTKLAVLRQFSK